jgi:putative ABC transport system permease protein
VKGQPELPANQLLTAVDSVVSADYFRVAGIPLLRGRGFTESDNATAPRVVVVNREFVHRHLKDAEALGKQIRVEVSDGPPEWSEIVGVIGNVKTYSEETHDDPAVYEGLQQRPVASLSLMVRTKSFDPNAVASAVRNELAQIDAELPIERVMSMENVIQLQMAGDPFMVRVLGTFAILALILAGIGIYGLVAYSVGQRTHEIGIRMALGANRRDVLRMVLWEGMKMTAFGTGIGLALALPLPKLFDAIFYNIRFREPGLYFVVPMAIVMVALAATYIPARRATQVDPMAALRQG